MDRLTRLVKLNYRLWPETHLLTPLRRLVRRHANRVLPQLLAQESYDQRYCESERLVVSMTSFTARIETVWMVVHCLLRQTYKPYKILLWLSEDQFPGGIESLPESLTSLQGEIFEIRMVEGDLRSHKKHYYVAQEFPDSLVMLVDDDIFYPQDMLERMMQAHKQYPEAVICQYGYEIGYDGDCMLPYRKWRHVNAGRVGGNLFFGSGGGTLIVPGKLYRDLGNKALFEHLTPQADDIWLNAMVRLAQLRVVMVKTGLILPIQNSDATRLADSNRYGDQNDRQLAQVREYYKSTLGVDPFQKL